MSSSSTPAARQVHWVDLPALGKDAGTALETPPATSSAVSPSENTRRYANPRHPLPVAATKVRTAANAGAVQGAATNPEVGPSRKGPREEPPAKPAAQPESRTGAFTVKTSKTARPNTSSRFPIRSRAQGLELTAPNRVPLSPATTPSVEYTRASPIAYVRLSRTARPRLTPAVPAPPRIPAVIGIIG